MRLLGAVGGVALAATVTCADAVRAQDHSFVGDAMTKLFDHAKTCAVEMKAIGFEFDEVRTELDLTPKLEIFFRDVSDNAPPASPVGVSPGCAKVANLLLATRRFRYGGFRLAGVKIDFPGLRAVLIHRAVH